MSKFQGTFQRNAEGKYLVPRSSLPLSCPAPDMELWCAHPKIYLPLTEVKNTAVCPYCGSQYVLVGEDDTSL